MVAAAGSSTRMGVPKQFLPLGGMPVIARTLLALDAAQLVDEIVLVAREEDMLQSVARGIAAAKKGTAFFAVHDGARPLVRPETVDRVIEAAFACGAATAAVRVKDTVKISDEKGFITATPDRRFLWNVQTPQVFERRLYLTALARAQAEGEDYTDDCQLVEHTGHPVRLVEADYGNIKITTPEDVAFAEGLLGREI